MTGQFQRDLVAPALLGGLVLIVLLIGFTVIQHAFAGGAISQEELGMLAGISRQMANQGLAKLADLGLIELGHGSVTIRDLVILPQSQDI